MGLSANRSGAPMGTPLRAPVYSKTPLVGSGVPQVQPMRMENAQAAPFVQYPHLRNFAQHGPLGGVLARIAGMENRPNPQDWQIDRTAYRRGF